MNEPTEIPRSFLYGYSKQDLVVIIQTTLEKARNKHQEARHWRSRCLAAEAELEALKAVQGLP